MNEIKINKQAKSITFIKNGIAFSQFGIAKEILDLVDNQQQEIDRLNNIISECLDSTCCIEHNLEKYEEIGLDHFDYALKKTTELKEFLIEELKDSD